MLSDQRTRATLRLQVRRELKDANEHLVSPRRWWTDTELDQYLDEWMADLQRQFQLINTSTTITVGSATATITTPSNMLRIDRVNWAGVRLLPTTLIGIDSQHPGWEAEPATTNAKPTQLINISRSVSRFYPLPGYSASVEIIGPATLTFTNDATPCPLPPWMYFSARLYCAMMAYLRAGPNQDLRKAGRYKMRYDRAKKFYRQLIDARFAAYGPKLKPASKYEGAILVGGGR